MVDRPILQTLNPAHDTMYLKLRKAKDERKETAQSIAHNTGVPESNVERLLRGEQSKPNAFYLAAICQYLGLSTDDILGIAQTEEAKLSAEKKLLADENARLKLENHDLKKDLEHEHQKFIAKDNELKARTPLIYTLAIISPIMAFALALYMNFDSRLTDTGLIQSESTSLLVPLMIVFMCGVIIAAGLLLKKAIKNERNKS